MNEMIGNQIHFFGISIFWGAFLLLFYDMFRIFRRVIPHTGFFVAWEDIIYWMISGVLIFRVMYQQNSGVIRGFSIAAILFGMIVYRWIINDSVVEFVTNLFLSLFAQIKKVLSILLKPLKIIRKSSKIIIQSFARKLIRIVKNRCQNKEKLYKRQKIQNDLSNSNSKKK